MSKSNQTSDQLSPNKSAKHWSQKIHETIVYSEIIRNRNLIERIKGGSDYGQFIYIGQIDELNVETLSGKIHSHEILLEINQQKISGYTLYDVLIWLKQLLFTYNTITLRTCKPQLINTNYDLRVYLDERFHKGSIDYDLQQTIRENVYMRTVPCTTRPPRNGEINGQDYIFLTNAEFLEMEKQGDLLEYGVYNGHYYGTPKPPKQPKTNNFSETDKMLAFNDETESLIGKKQALQDNQVQSQSGQHVVAMHDHLNGHSAKLNKYQSINYIQTNKIISSSEYDSKEDNDDDRDEPNGKPLNDRMGLIPKSC